MKWGFVAQHPLFSPARRAAVGLLLATMTLSFTVDTGSAAPPVAAKTSVPCERPGHGFKPAKARIPAVGRTVGVVVVQRTSNNQVGAGPTTEEGKWLMAMDPKTRPGSGRGTVLLSAHTWPDGSALGNAMLKNLRSGDRITMVGKYGEQACYGIYKRVSYPKNEVPPETFSAGGFERLVIVTCSGRRNGPGNWSHRTVWYAKVVKPTTSPPAPAPDNDPEPDDSPTLLGGLLGGF